MYNNRMSRITVSLPEKLKEQTRRLVDLGYFSSLSDAVRSALRDKAKETKYELLAQEAKEELKSNQAIILKDEQDIEKYLKDR